MQDNNKNNNVKKILYSHCAESNFTILSNNKNINQPTSKTSLSKNFSISNSNIFIGARQNLKAMNIRISNYSKYNNTVHKEISNFKNGKGKSVEKTKISLSENDALRSNNLDSQNKKDETVNVLKEIALRWKNNQQICKSNLSFISKINNKDDKDYSIINKEIYIKELLNSIIINKEVINNINNNKEYYILIKHNKSNANEHMMHEIINPNSKEELEKSINNFIYKKNNKENQNNNIETAASCDNSTFINGKKKSKFSHSEHKKSTFSNANNTEVKKEEFIPIFILTKTELINLYEIIEGKSKTSTNIKEKIEYSIANNISYNIINSNKTEKLGSSQENKNTIKENNQDENDKNEIKKNLDNINFNLFPIKVEKFELINKMDSDKKRNGNYNINEISTELNKNNNIETLNEKENGFDNTFNKKKEMEDFGQATPISLLKEKCFIYIVSKWVKYSIPQPQSQIYAKYSYKNGHPLFDPIILQMTNFTLWIERVETKNNLHKKSFMSINSGSNYGDNIKKTNSKGFKKK